VGGEGRIGADTKDSGCTQERDVPDGIAGLGFGDGGVGPGGEGGGGAMRLPCRL
jgi:hypothetical protein